MIPRRCIFDDLGSCSLAVKYRTAILVVTACVILFSGERNAAFVAAAPASSIEAPTAKATALPRSLAETASPTNASPRTEAADAPRPPSQSIGWPWRGKLLDGAHLQATTNVHLVEADLERGFHYGTAELVGLVHRAAAFVHDAAPGARLQVGELSKEGGGNIPGHRSHENGRDVDLGFYLLDDSDTPVDLARFANVNRSGKGWLEEKTIRFDTTRNWLLVRALIEDTEAHVKYIFVARALRARLLREGARQGADAELLDKAERILLPPLGSSNPHRNHFHVRIYCPADDMPECRDRGPFYPWLPATHPLMAAAEAG